MELVVPSHADYSDSWTYRIQPPVRSSRLTAVVSNLQDRTVYIHSSRQHVGLGLIVCIASEEQRRFAVCESEHDGLVVCIVPRSRVGRVENLGPDSVSEVNLLSSHSKRIGYVFILNQLKKASVCFGTMGDTRIQDLTYSELAENRDKAKDMVVVGMSEHHDINPVHTFSAKKRGHNLSADHIALGIACPATTVHQHGLARRSAQEDGITLAHVENDYA